MLIELRVKNFGIIEEINWHLSRGLNIITGETGAGKSLVIDAVEALIAGKADERNIRHGASDACVEAIFALHEGSISHRIKDILAENGLNTAEEELVIIGEFRRGGRSIFRVNDKTVTRGFLQNIGKLIFDIHGQSEHLSLLNKDFHLSFLDVYAHTMNLRQQFGLKSSQLLQIEQELRLLSEAEKDSLRRDEFVRFQIEEIRRAELKLGEEENLEKERKILSSSEKLKSASYEAYKAIYGDDRDVPNASVLEKLNEAVLAIHKLIELDDTLKPQMDYLKEVISGLEETARDFRNYSDHIEYDPQRLEEIELRFELIRNLKNKYGQTIAEVLDYLEQTEKHLEEISHSQERRLELEEQLGHLKKEMGGIAAELTKLRKSAAQELESAVLRELKELSMPQIKFEVYITQNKSPEGIPLPDGDYYGFNREGIDNVEFMASTNPGEPLKPLNIIASTGEMSRFMLALKSALAKADNIPILIFDEIDVGVGGRSGEIVGKKLWVLARERQAICITHLPQIAAFADAHFSVHKEAFGNRTISMLETLQGDDRIREITVMLSGPQHTEVAVKNARELVKKIDTWKESYRDSR